jgi:hypothetical protein
MVHSGWRMIPEKKEEGDVPKKGHVKLVDGGIGVLMKKPMLEGYDGQQNETSTRLEKPMLSRIHNKKTMNQEKENKKTNVKYRSVFSNRINLPFFQ